MTQKLFENDQFFRGLHPLLIFVHFYNRLMFHSITHEYTIKYDTRLQTTTCTLVIPTQHFTAEYFLFMAINKAARSAASHKMTVQMYSTRIKKWQRIPA